jgi:hypothetical protein
MDELDAAFHRPKVELADMRKLQGAEKMIQDL